MKKKFDLLNQDFLFCKGLLPLLCKTYFSICHICPFVNQKKILKLKIKYVCIQKLKYSGLNVDHWLECDGWNISKFLGLYAMSYSSLVVYTINLLSLRKAMSQEVVNYSHCLKVDWQLNIVFCTNYEREKMQFRYFIYSNIQSEYRIVSHMH